MTVRAAPRALLARFVVMKLSRFNCFWSGWRLTACEKESGVEKAFRSWIFETRALEIWGPGLTSHSIVA